MGILEKTNQEIKELYRQKEALELERIVLLEKCRKNMAELERVKELISEKFAIKGKVLNNLKGEKVDSDEKENDNVRGTVRGSEEARQGTA
jgi:hypothetical protein